ncbi:MAG: hypothetical protein GX174_14000 [Lentisphaerae bacterium]|jgi:hypothetical protein|nr:hypothetical protein [Lentisphaerota bacterium]
MSAGRQITPADYKFRKVAERRFMLDAELPYDGAFLPAARYEIDVAAPGRQSISPNAQRDG